MKRLGLALLTALSAAAQPFGSFAEAEVRVLERDAAPDAKARLPLTLVLLRGTNWSEKRVLRHVERTERTLAACGVALGPVTLVKAKTSDGRHDLDMANAHPESGTPWDVFRIAGMLPKDTRWPVAFFVGRLLGDEALARSYALGAAPPGSEPKYPYMNTAWFAYKAHWIERQDDSYSSLAHELTHLLCACGHLSSEERHMMNTHRNMLSSRILPEHCELVLKSPLLSLSNRFVTTVNH